MTQSHDCGSEAGARTSTVSPLIAIGVVAIFLSISSVGPSSAQEASQGSPETTAAVTSMRVDRKIREAEVIDQLSRDGQLELVLAQEHRVYMCWPTQARVERNEKNAYAIDALAGQLTFVGRQEFRDFMPRTPQAAAQRRNKHSQVVATFDDTALAALCAKEHGKFMQQTAQQIANGRLKDARGLARLTDKELSSTRASERASFMRRSKVVSCHRNVNRWLRMVAGYCREALDETPCRSRRG